MTTQLLVSERPAEAAAATLVAAAREVLDREGRLRIAIPGGSAMGAFVDMAKQIERERDRICLTWVDERCVPRNNEQSNRGALHRALGLQLPTELPLWLDGEDVDQALARVREGLTRVFAGALDVNLLGMGEDGHIASLFVGRTDPPGERVIHVPDSPKPPPARMSLTRTMLRTAPRSILVATGEAKRAALKRLLAGDKELPAVGLPNLTIVTDQDLEGAS